MMSLNGLRFPIGALSAEYGLKDEADAAASARGSAAAPPREGLASELNREIHETRLSCNRCRCCMPSMNRSKALEANLLT
jgi:hypothetical protein